MKKHPKNSAIKQCNRLAVRKLATLENAMKAARTEKEEEKPDDQPTH